MAMNMTVWRIHDERLEPLQRAKLDQEARLEKWVAADPDLLGLDILVIGQQVTTSFGGRIDLLGIDDEGDLVVIELKRGKTPRDIVAQVLDYASWVDGLGHNDVDQVAMGYLNKSLGAAFSEHFGAPLPESINGSQQLVIVAAELDDASERITEFLASRHGIDINVVFFNVFEHDGRELLARSWLLDPEKMVETTRPPIRPRWSGVWYVNVGVERDGKWEDRRKYGFLSAGGGEVFTGPLRRLKIGDRLFAYSSQNGYVGYGEVTQERTLETDFRPEGQNKTLPELPLQTPIPARQKPGKEGYAVGVRWLESVPIEEAKRFKGAFANMNVVCKLREPATLEFLNKEFHTSKYRTD